MGFYWCLEKNTGKVWLILIEKFKKTIPPMWINNKTIEQQQGNGYWNKNKEMDFRTN